MATSSLRRPLAAACLLLASLTVVGCGSADRRQEMIDARRPSLAAPAVPADPLTPPAATPAGPPKPSIVKPQPGPAIALPPPTPPAGTPRNWALAVAARKWEWVVIHHSATPVGGAARFGREHVAKGWDELGYHFVIGNGTDTANGATEVGSRWPKQKQGAHCKTPDNGFNEKGIGVCLVGNFDTARPTDAQLKSLAKLVAYLQKTYHIPADHIIGHGDAKATECPGKNLHIAQVRRLSAQALAEAGDSSPLPVRTASARPGQELLLDAR